MHTLLQFPPLGRQRLSYPGTCSCQHSPVKFSLKSHVNKAAQTQTGEGGRTGALGQIPSPRGGKLE